MRRTLFTADTHWGHANIIHLCKRPFRDVDDMDAALIRNWNAIVGQHDLVYHLGDFSMGHHDAEYYLGRLNGVIRLILGNHDKKAVRAAHRFESIDDLAQVVVEGQTIVLCHYAMRTWNHSHHGSWHLYGHSHGTLPDDPNSLSLDIGVDCWDYTPVSIPQIRARMARKAWKPIDHHTQETASP